MYQITTILLMPGFYDRSIFEKYNGSKQIKTLTCFAVLVWALAYAKGFSENHFVLKNSLSKTLLQKQNEEGCTQKDLGAVINYVKHFDFFE